MTWKYGTAGAYIPVIGRTLLALIFIIAGWGKFMGLAGTAGYIASVGLPFPMVLAVAAVAIELIGGIALLVGFHARLAAWILIVFTALATVFFHAAWSDPLQQGMALKNLAMIGGLLYVAKFGPGMWAFKMGKDCGCCDDGSCVCDCKQNQGSGMM
jgi:putative oxidoreductase